MDLTEYKSIKILFEDNHLLVCVKPPGILSQADGKNLDDMLTLLKEYIKEKYQKPGNVFLGLVHRLDLNVGGVMVFAKTSKAAARLSKAIREHDFTKEYLAVINADLPLGQTETLTDLMAKNDSRRVGYITEDEETGKIAKLRYTVIGKIVKESNQLTLVKITLLSGRFHQIRLQFATRGWPLHGDQKYGDERDKNQKELGLYAFCLSFPHPITQDPITFEWKPDSVLFTQFH